MNIINKNNIKYNFIIYINLFIFLLFLRSYHSFFGLSVGEHDWTWLSIGKSLFNGNLPYIEEWVLRGPFTFVFYALPFLFKNYILALKFLGIVSIWISSIALYKISERLYGKKAGIFSSFGFILISSSEISFLTSEPELFIFPFLSFFIYFLLKNLINPNKYDIILAGILISLATLMRLNLGLLAILGCFVYLFSEKNKLLNIIIYILSGLIPLLITIILYSNIPNGLEILWSSTVLSHIAFPTGRPFFIGFFLFLDVFTLKQWYPIFIFAIFMPLVNKKPSKELFLLLLFLVSIMFSILLARKFSTYNIMVTFPFLAVMASSFFDKNNNYPKKVLVGFIIFCYLGPLINNLMEQVKLNYRPVNKTIVLANFLKKIIKEEENIFSFDNGLYLLLNKELPTKISHPADIFRYHSLRAYYRDPEYNAEIELNKIINKNPDYIVILKIWENVLPSSFKDRLNEDYRTVNFISEKEKKSLKKVNKEYLSSTTLFKINK